MAQELTEQDIVKRIKRLEPGQISEVLDFIEFLAEKRHDKPPLLQFLRDISVHRVGLEEVRRHLARIPGKMFDTVRELRDERG
jgi:hypothetical protein